MFAPDESTPQNLIRQSNEADFYIFVYASDDQIAAGSEPAAKDGKATPRDNVVLEAGIFIGAIGQQRSLIVQADSLWFPTDLEGLIVKCPLSWRRSLPPGQGVPGPEPQPPAIPVAR